MRNNTSGNLYKDFNKADYKLLNYKGIIFDDFELKAEDSTNSWACICKDCAKTHEFEDVICDDGPAESVCSVWGCENEADHYIDFDGSEVVCQQSEILKQERFFLRNGFIEEIYYNPDSVSGGQFVHVHIGHSVIDKVVTESIEADGFFDFIESESQQFLSDVGSDSFAASLREFNHEPFLVSSQGTPHTERERALIAFESRKNYDNFRTGERIRTPRGTFALVNMTPEQMESIGYGFHHCSDDRKYAIMGNGTNAFAVLNV